MRWQLDNGEWERREYSSFPQTLTLDAPEELIIAALDQPGTDGPNGFVQWEWRDEGVPEKQYDMRNEIRAGVLPDTTVVRTPVYIRAALTVHDGNNGGAVAEAEELTRGAFTLANLNDTDGDGVEDWEDSTVPGEVDLMKVVFNLETPVDDVAWASCPCLHGRDARGMIHPSGDLEQARNMTAWNVLCV